MQAYNCIIEKELRGLIHDQCTIWKSSKIQDQEQSETKQLQKPY